MPITPISTSVAIRTLLDSTSRTRLPQARPSAAASLATALPGSKCQTFYHIYGQVTTSRSRFEHSCRPRGGLLGERVGEDGGCALALGELHRHQPRELRA